MDLVYSAIIKTCGFTYREEQNYVFILNVGEDIVCIVSLIIHPNQVFVLPECLVRKYANFLDEYKLAVVGYLVKGEEQPWS